MKPFILIRDYNKNDDVSTQDLIKCYIMSYAWSSFIQCLFREITIQLIVLMWAVLFIFVGIPLHLCFLSVPVVIFLILFCVYAVHYNKGFELANMINVKQGFIAEVYEPFLLLHPEESKFDVVETINGSDCKNMRKKIIGTISIRSHESLHNAGWLCRFAMDPKYPCHAVIEGLTQKAVQHSLQQGWNRLETVTTECQDDVREAYSKLGFTIRQVYHKQIVGSSLRVMKSQLGLDLVKYMASKSQ